MTYNSSIFATLLKYVPLNMSIKHFNRGKHLFILCIIHIPPFIIIDTVYP